MVFRTKRRLRARELLTLKVMVFTDYAKRRILHFREKGCSFAEIVKRLHEENISASKAGVWSFLITKVVKSVGKKDQVHILL